MYAVSHDIYMGHLGTLVHLHGLYYSQLLLLPALSLILHSFILY